MALAKDYNSVMARSEEIMKKALGLDYSRFESGSIAFDYEKLMKAARLQYRGRHRDTKGNRCRKYADAGA